MLHRPHFIKKTTATRGRGILPEIQVPLKYLGFKFPDKISFNSILLPESLGPGSGGVTTTTARATRPITDNITKIDMPIPFQLCWLGTAATNSCNEEETIVGYFQSQRNWTSQWCLDVDERKKSCMGFE